MPARKFLLSTALAVAAFTALALPGRAEAHGDCGPGLLIENATAVVTMADDYANPDKVHGYIRFLCSGHEKHAKIFVHIRLYKCPRLTMWCDGPLTLLSGVSKYCYDTYYCIRTTGEVNCNSGYKYLTYGRWRAWNASGTVVHENSAWPDFNRELGSAISGSYGVNC